MSIEGRHNTFDPVLTHSDAKSEQHFAKRCGRGDNATAIAARCWYCLYRHEEKCKLDRKHVKYVDFERCTPEGEHIKLEK